jgi:hypothetical protein
LKTLENLVGKERLLAALGSYARRFAFKHPTRADLFAALHDGLGGEHDAFIEAAFLAPGGVDFRVRLPRNHRRHEPRGVFGEGDARRTVAGNDTPKAFRSEVTVVNLGPLVVPADVVVSFADGQTARERWDGRGGWHTFVFERDQEVVGAEVDPEHRVVVEHERLTNGVGPVDQGAALRAAVRAGFWQQTLAQLVGL